MKAAFPWMSLAVVLLSGLFAALGLEPALEYHRLRIGAEPWRWWTAQLAHFGSSHFLWDASVVLVLGVICERNWPKPTRWFIALSLPLVTLAVHVAMPELLRFRGLSGVATGLFGLGAVAWMGGAVSRREWVQAALGGAVLVLVAGKIAVEVIGGTAVFVEEGAFEVVPWAHAAGLVAGLLAGAVAAAGECARSGGQDPGRSSIVLPYVHHPPPYLLPDGGK